MNENELKLLWQSDNKKTEDRLAVNKKNIEDITKLKVLGFLSSTKPIKIFTLIAGILWVRSEERRVGKEGRFRW